MRRMLWHGSAGTKMKWRAFDSGGGPVVCCTQCSSAIDANPRAPARSEQEGVTDAYVCRLLPLTCLAPDIVEAILDGRQPKGLTLTEVLGNGPLDWHEQRVHWCFCFFG